jgi:hypothetical protein
MQYDEDVLEICARDANLVEFTKLDVDGHAGEEA